MKKFLLLVSLLISNLTFAQHQADRWYFGTFVGISFLSGSPVIVPGALNTTEGSTTASDAAGNLRFYSDGMSVWNKNSVLMTNGTGLLGNVSSTSSALAVPYPSNNDLYYLFTLDEAGSTNGFRYSIVDMSLGNGLGDVTSKNIFIKQDVTEKMAAVAQDAANAYWVAVHEWGTNAFYVYNVTASGFQPTPVISNVGMVHTIDANEQNKYGQMKFNACGTKLALAIGYLDTVQVFDFNPSTGVVSNPITIPMSDHTYGVEFSQDGSKLYATSYNTAAGYSMLKQFDLSLATEAAINASAVTLNTNTSGTSFFYALQLGPDGKVYSSKSWSNFLGAVNEPDLAGTACNYDDMAVDLDPNFMGNQSAVGLPSFVQSYFRGEMVCITPTSLNENNPGTLHLSLADNPSSGEFKINFPESDFNIIIFDNAGREIQQMEKVNAGDFYFGKQLASGVYFIAVEKNSSKQILKAIKL